jgi:hypothetical protein
MTAGGELVPRAGPPPPGPAAAAAELLARTRAELPVLAGPLFLACKQHRSAKPQAKTPLDTGPLLTYLLVKHSLHTSCTQRCLTRSPSPASSGGFSVTLSNNSTSQGQP